MDPIGLEILAIDNGITIALVALLALWIAQQPPREP
jgi:hypothetical protein